MPVCVTTLMPVCDSMTIRLSAKNEVPFMMPAWGYGFGLINAEPYTAGMAPPPWLFEA